MLEQPTAIETGLFTKDAAPVPLTGVSIDAEISSFCARVAVTQRYVNRESTPIEAVYVFPLDEGAAVCGFEAIVDGTLVVGEVKERDEAFRMYDDAIERGDGGFLLDEERADVFQASVGNLPPGKEVLLKLTYVTELAVEGSALRFSIPTTVSPRYAPVEDHVGVGRPDAATLNPPVAWRVPYGLSLSIRLAMPNTISQVESPSHPVSVAMNGQEATVTLSQRDAALDRDFVLSIEAAGLYAPQPWVERDDDGAEAVAVAFVPDLGQASMPNEVIFIVDRSGSMGGTSIEEVRNALQLCLRSMIPGCYFNIVGFGSSVHALFSESRAYDEASLAEASAHVTALQADLGGTQILPALQFVFEQPRHRTLPRQVVVLTDGEVTNTDAVLALATKHSADARVFTFGIGAGASHHLVRGLARAGAGTAEFIYPGERIEPKVVRQFGRLLSPALTNVCMDWGGLGVTQAPANVPPVFGGGRLVLYGFLKDARSTQIRLSATGPTGPLAFDVPFDPGRTRPGRTVAILAARARIRELEESPEWLNARGSRQKGRKESSATQEIIALSTRYGLISRETSFVAIERRDTPVTGDVQLRRVPIALTTGWGGLDRLHEAMRVTLGAMPAPIGPDRLWLTPASQSKRSDAGVFSLEGTWLARWDPQERASVNQRAEAPPSGRRQRPPAPPFARPTAAPAPAAMHSLVTLQRADGSWDLTPELAAAIGRELSDLEAALAGASGDREDVRRAWATALALAWLREYAGHAEDEWRFLAAKARKWLDNVEAVPPDRWTWVDTAARFLREQPLRSHEP